MSDGHEAPAAAATGTEPSTRMGTEASTRMGAEPTGEVPDNHGLPIPIVAIGASAGGLEALQMLFDAAPETSGAAYIVVQHLDPDHESLMADILSRHTHMPVSQARDGMEPEADTVTLIPPNVSMTMRNGVLRLETFPQPRGVRRPIDTFFLSLADDMERGFACVVLSGTGSDGSRALRAVKEAGGIAVVQEPGQAKFDGMPRAAIDTTFVDFVLPAGQIAPGVMDYFARRSRDATLHRTLVDVLPDIAARLEHVTGHDFAGYKRPTLLRRISRRMQVTNSGEPQIYLERLRSDPDECHELLAEILINVTNFFRDPEVFELLRTEVIPNVVKRAEPKRGVRVWVAGCSSGEEAYSLAMLLHREVSRSGRHLAVQIFGTDIDAKMLEVARAARYPLDTIKDIPEPYRSEYLIGNEADFTVTPQVREMVRFAHHSVIKDPPFSKLDLISCRNMLIYLGSKLQEHVLPMFHYALNEEGTLILGTSEGIGPRTTLFADVHRSKRIYRRRPGVGRIPRIETHDLAANGNEGEREGAGRGENGAGSGRVLPGRSRAATPAMSMGGLDAASRRVMEHYAPAYLVVDAEGALVRSSGRLTKYLEIPQGFVSTDLADLARPGLRAPLRRVMTDARRERRRVAIADVEVASELGLQTVDLVCDPLPDGTHLVVIRDVSELRALDEDTYRTTVEAGRLADRGDPDLEGELRDVRFRLRTTVEELEAANEELKSSNEEMMSMNEELQSANEELTTVNEELKIKVDEVAATNADLRNFLSSTDIATIILDSDLAVRVHTPRARDIYPLREADAGRSLEDMTPRLANVDVIADARAVLDSGESVRREVATRDGTGAYMMSVVPFEMSEGRTDGVVLTFADVTEIKRVRDDLSRERERVSLALQAAHLGVWEWRPVSHDIVVDPRIRELFDLPPEPAEVTYADVGARIEPGDLAIVNDALEDAVATKGEYAATFRVRPAGGGVRILDGIGRAVLNAEGKVTAVMGINRDITQERQREDHSHLLMRELNHRVKNIVAVIGSVIRNAGARATDLHTFVADCETRIAAVSRAHTLLVESNWRHTSLPELVATTLAIFEETGRIAVECVDMDVPPMEGQTLSLVLHELATNAIKHGALSVPGGRATLDVEAAEETDANGAGRIRLAWHETGGPPVSAPARTGFGTLLLRDMVAHQHDGEAQFDWNANGLGFTLDMEIAGEAA